MQEFLIVTFNNTHEAMKAELACVNEGIKVTMMPTPTYITKSCGISLRANIDIIDNFKKMVENKEIEYKTIYHFKDNKLTEINIV